MINSKLEEFMEKALAEGIQSTRIKLVELSPDLAKSIFDCNSGSVKDYFIDFGNIDQVYNWIGEYKGLMEKGIKIEFVIEHKINSELIGMVALDELNTEKALIRVWINPDIRSKDMPKRLVDTLYLPSKIFTQPNQ